MFRDGREAMKWTLYGYRMRVVGSWMWVYKIMLSGAIRTEDESSLRSACLHDRTTGVVGCWIVWVLSLFNLIESV